MNTDPALDPSVFDKLYHSGAWVPLGILVAFFGLRAASTRIAWLKEDHRAAWVAALLGGLAMLVVPATQGETPNLSMIIGAIVAVATLHTDPKKLDTAPVAKQAGFISLGLMVVIAAIASSVLLFGCGASTRLKTLNATTASVSAADMVFNAFEKQHEIDLANSPAVANRAEAQALVAAFIVNRDKARKAITAALNALSAAWKLDDDTSVANAVKAATAVTAALAALGVQL